MRVQWRGMKMLSRLPLWAALWMLAVGFTLPQWAGHSLQAASIRSSACDFRVYALLFRSPLRVLGYDTVHTGVAIALLLATVILIGECGRRIFSRTGASSLPTLIALQALVGVVLAFSPLTFSPDPTAYVLYARLYGLFGINPYHTPLIVPHDDILATVVNFWEYPTPGNVYGPLWTLVVGAIARLQAEAPLITQWMTQRFLAIFASVIAGAGLYRIIRRDSDEHAALTRVARFAFHPLVLLETAIDGHNDMVMVACGVWAFALLEEFPLAAGVLLGASIAVKYLSVVAAPFFFVMLWRAHKRHTRAILTASAGMGAVIAASFAPFWFGLRTLEPIFTNQSDVAASPAALLADVYTAAAHITTDGPVFPGQEHWHMFRHATAGLFIDLALVAIWLILAAIALYRFARTKNFSPAYLTAVSFMAVIPALPAYYLLWLSPLLAERGRWGRYVWWLLATALLYNAQSIMGHLSREYADDVYVLALLFVPPAIALMRPAPAQAH